MIRPFGKKQNTLLARITCFVLALAAMAGCAFSRRDAPAQPGLAPPVVSAFLERSSDGSWLLTYRFPVTAPAWKLTRTHPSFDGANWRSESWTIETPRVRLERRGSDDVLVSEGAFPGEVRVRVRPFSEPLRADYTPYIPFTDGGLAIYSGQFAVEPWTDAPAEAAPAPAVEIATRLTVRSRGGGMLLRGRRHAEEASLTLGDGGAYIYVGDGRMQEGPAFAAVVDPGLPQWIRSELDLLVPRLLALYRQRLGQPSVSRPSLLAAWGGTAYRGSSLGGGVLPGMVILDMEGDRLAERSDREVERIRTFLAHEAAHFWIGHTIGYEGRADGWITEGAAELLAIRARALLNPEFDAPAALTRLAAECVQLIQPGEPLGGATDRGDWRAPYACGAVLAAAATAPRAGANRAAHDDFKFFADLVTHNRADGIVTRQEWLAAFTAARGDTALAREVAAFVDAGVPEPRALLDRLLR
jgi:hypothetical protein